VDGACEAIGWRWINHISQGFEINRKYCRGISSLGEPTATHRERSEYFRSLHAGRHTDEVEIVGGGDRMRGTRWLCSPCEVMTHYHGGRS